MTSVSWAGWLSVRGRSQSWHKLPNWTSQMTDLSKGSNWEVWRPKRLTCCKGSTTLLAAVHHWVQDPSPVLQSHNGEVIYTVQRNRLTNFELQCFSTELFSSHFASVIMPHRKPWVPRATVPSRESIWGGASSQHNCGRETVSNCIAIDKKNLTKLR